MQDLQYYVDESQNKTESSLFILQPSLYVDNATFVLPAVIHRHTEAKPKVGLRRSKQRMSDYCVAALTENRLQVLTGCSPHTPTHTKLVVGWTGHISSRGCKYCKRHKGDVRPRNSRQQAAMFNGSHITLLLFDYNDWHCFGTVIALATALQIITASLLCLIMLI